VRGEMIRRQRVGDLKKILRWRYGHALPDDDAGREDLRELLLPISMGREAGRKMKNAIEIWAPWMDATEAGQLIDDVDRTPTYLRKPNARELGLRQNVTNQTREALGLRTIAPSDMTPAQLVEWRKTKKRARDERRRRKAGKKPRPAYLANSLSRTKPWEMEGICRRTWERRRQKQRVASQRSIKLLIAKRPLATPTNFRRCKAATDKARKERKGVGHGLSQGKKRRKGHGRKPVALLALGADLRQ
jgi:hypothetical protein